MATGLALLGALALVLGGGVGRPGGDVGGAPEGGGAAQAPAGRREEGVPTPTPAATPTPTPLPLEGVAPRAGGVLVLSPEATRPGVRVGVQGYGFPPGAAVRVAVVDGTGLPVLPVALAEADAEGRLGGVAFVVPQGLPAGRYVVQAAHAAGVAAVPLLVAGGYPDAEPERWAVLPLEEVVIAGSGFAPGEAVRAHVDSLALPPVATATAGGQGDVTLRFPLPLVGQGTHPVFVLGEETQVPVTVPLTVLGFEPWVLLSSYAAPPETSLGFEGHGFARGEEVTVTWERTGRVVATLRADDAGSFAAEEVFLVPAGAEGTNTFTFTGRLSRRTVEATLEVLPFSPTLELTSYVGPPGSVVAFTGSGYARGEVLRAYLGTPEEGVAVAAFRAGPEGAFEAQGAFPIPYDHPGGEATVTLVGERSGAPVSLAFSVSPLAPWAALSAVVGRPGAALSVAGGGFGAQETLAVTLGEETVTVRTDAEGAFEGAGPLRVPEDATGTVTVRVVGRETGAQAEAAFAVVPEGDGAAPAPAPTTPAPAATPTPPGP